MSYTKECELPLHQSTLPYILLSTSKDSYTSFEYLGFLLSTFHHNSKKYPSTIVAGAYGRIAIERQDGRLARQDSWASRQDSATKFVYILLLKSRQKVLWNVTWYLIDLFINLIRIFNQLIVKITHNLKPKKWIFKRPDSTNSKAGD